MGFHDCRCMATGVSLKGADAALVLLLQLAGEYAPLSLAIKGNYNRLGSINGIKEDANSRLVLSSSIAARIYAGSLGEVSGHVGELVAVDAFVRGRGLRWQPSEAAGQDYPEEMRQYLGEAQRTFADSATITVALRRYEDEVGELLEDG